MPVEKKRILDFTNVQDPSNFNPVHMEPGDYLFEVVDVSDGSSSKGNDYWNFHCRLVDRPRAMYPYRCTLNAEALWKIRNLFLACGKKVGQKRLNVDPNLLIGKQFGGTLEDEEYQGKMKSVITGVFPASDVPEKTKKTSPTTEVDEEDVDEDDIEDELDVDEI